MSDDEDAIAGVQLESVSSKTAVVQTACCVSSKPPATKGLAPSPYYPNLSDATPRGPRVDSVNGRRSELPTFYA